MRLSAGSRDRELRVLCGTRLMQTRDEIAWQERTVRRCTQDPRTLRPIRPDPVERRQDARERSRKIRYRIGDHRKPERREPRRIAIGVEDEPVALRREPRDHTFEDGAA